MVERRGTFPFALWDMLKGGILKKPRVSQQGLYSLPFDRLMKTLTGKNIRRVALFGSGGYASRFIDELPRWNIEVAAVIESTPENSDKTCRGFDVMPLEHLETIHIDGILLSDGTYHSQRQARETLGMCFDHIPIFMVASSDGLRPIKNDASLFTRSLYRRPSDDLIRKGHPCRVVMAPVFTQRDRLYEEYWRLLWFLPQQEGVEVTIPVEIRLFQDLPEPKDFVCPPMFGNWSGADKHIRLQPVTGDSIPDNFMEADLAIVWKSDALTSEYLEMLNKIPNVFLVDKHHKRRRSGFNYSYLDYYLQPKETVIKIKEQSKRNLAAMARKLSHLQNSYIFGSGPSLGRAGDFDFSDGIRIICNTIVKNDELLDHIKPHFIVAADGDYHFGNARYAAQFRSDLVRAMKKTGAMLVCPDFFVPLMIHHYPKVADSIIGVPVVKSRLNTRLLERFWLAARDNVLVLFLIPLAASLSKRIHMLGFDGRKPGDQKFWNYDSKSQYDELMASIEFCHPAFYDYVDYQDAFERHCRLVEEIITFAESQGNDVISLAESVISPISARHNIIIENNTNENEK